MGKIGSWKKIVAFGWGLVLAWGLVCPAGAQEALGGRIRDKALLRNPALYKTFPWGIRNRDYMARRTELFEGAVPEKGTDYVLAHESPYLPFVTLVMSFDKALFLEVSPNLRLGNVQLIMLGSKPQASRELVPAWGVDGLTNPIRFWTDQYWKPDKCDPSGCPRLLFQVVTGIAEITILDLKPNGMRRSGPTAGRLFHD